MSLPPFVLAAVLAFWGWRSGNYAAGALLAVLLEAPRYLRLRFELSYVDFTRVAQLCTVLFVGLLAYLFATVEPPHRACGSDHHALASSGACAAGPYAAAFHVRLA